MTGKLDWNPIRDLARRVLSCAASRLLCALLVLSGCASKSPRAGPGFPGPTPRQYSQSLDSATSGCLRNPACYTQTGEEAILPWLERSLNALRTLTATLQLLEAAEVQQVEQVLVQCAKEAHLSINEELGYSPTEAQCQEVIRREGDTDITRRMELGRQKHARALECVRKQFEVLYRDNVSTEPLYQKDSRTGRWRWVDPLQVAQWLSDGLFHLLRGALVPDVVVHAAGDPNKVQRIYDFKFPCPAGNSAKWSPYPWGHPYFGRDQGHLYGELGSSPRTVHPLYGVGR